MKELIKKLQSDSLSEEDKELLIKTLKEQSECIKYYSQNFAGTWDNDVCNINWRANKCNELIQGEDSE